MLPTSQARDDLRSAGISLDPGDGPPALRAECARLARILRLASIATVGLSPAGDDVAVPAVALNLARALSRALKRPAGVVDALGTWGVIRPGPGAVEGDATVTWLVDGLALVTLRPAHPSLARPGLIACLARERAAFGGLVVDLTGFEHLGERRAAIEALDVTVVVARAGRTSAGQIEAALQDVPKDRGLGVLLTGIG